MTEQPQQANELTEKLVTASKLIGPIAKGGSNSYQGYQFQSEAQIKAAVKAALESTGLSIIPQFKITSQRDVSSSRGRVNHIVDVLGHFIITDGHERLEGYMPGSGMDTGEKATSKACTSAQKYFYKQLFNISDQEADPDETNSNPNGSQGQPNQRPQNNYTNRQKRNYNNRNNRNNQPRNYQNNGGQN